MLLLSQKIDWKSIWFDDHWLYNLGLLIVIFELNSKGTKGFSCSICYRIRLLKGWFRKEKSLKKYLQLKILPWKNWEGLLARHLGFDQTWGKGSNSEIILFEFLWLLRLDHKRQQKKRFFQSYNGTLLLKLKWIK